MPTSDLSLFAISGSLRAASFNTMLLRAAEELAPEGVRFDHYERLEEVPPYNQDRDQHDPPEPVTDLRRRIHEADGVLIATPEYNYGIPGVLKNAIDWASRPPTSSALLHKHVAIMGTAAGFFGSVRAQLALRQSFLWIDAKVMGKPEMIVPKAAERFGADGSLTDETTEELLRGFLLAFTDRIRADEGTSGH